VFETNDTTTTNTSSKTWCAGNLRIILLDDFVYVNSFLLRIVVSVRFLGNVF
jgi:hypothetical protein